MDLETYLRMVDVVRGRNDGSKLTIVFTDMKKVNYGNLRHHFSRHAHVVEMITGRNL